MELAATALAVYLVAIVVPSAYASVPHQPRTELVYDDPLNIAVYHTIKGSRDRNAEIQSQLDLLRQEIQELRTEVANAAQLPLGSFCTPATGCMQIFQSGITTNGLYWINNTIELVQVYCDFDLELPPPSPLRGWQEVANIDLTDPASSCPSPWREVDVGGSRRCEMTSDSGGCEAVFFRTSSVPFSRLCGRAVGYDSGSADAFVNFGICSGSSLCDSIDGPYVDGLSITYSNGSTRQHIWSLAGVEDNAFSTCPCDPNSGFADNQPLFVGDNYYCEARVDGQSQLWEGVGCTDPPTASGDGPCCENVNFPWFCREFEQPIVTESIEVRICRDEDRSNEDIDIDLLRMYIQ